MLVMTNLAELLKLAATERLELIDALWDSLEAESADLPISDELRAELERRMAEPEKDPSTAIDWEDFRKELQPSIK
jgi:putative addiction module component (TIGR02574 family)